MMPDILLVGAEKSTEPVLLHVTNKPLIISYETQFKTETKSGVIKHKKV